MFSDLKIGIKNFIKYVIKPCAVHAIQQKILEQEHKPFQRLGVNQQMNLPLLSILGDFSFDSLKGSPIWNLIFFNSISFSW